MKVELNQASLQAKTADSKEQLRSNLAFMRVLGDAIKEIHDQALEQAQLGLQQHDEVKEIDVTTTQDPTRKSGNPEDIILQALLKAIDMGELLNENNQSVVNSMLLKTSVALKGIVESQQKIEEIRAQIANLPGPEELAKLRQKIENFVKNYADLFDKYNKALGNEAKNTASVSELQKVVDALKDQFNKINDKNSPEAKKIYNEMLNKAGALDKAKVALEEAKKALEAIQKQVQSLVLSLDELEKQNPEFAELIAKLAQNASEFGSISDPASDIFHLINNFSEREKELETSLANAVAAQNVSIQDFLAVSTRSHESIDKINKQQIEELGNELLKKIQMDVSKHQNNKALEDFDKKSKAQVDA